MRKDLLACGILILLTLAAYGQSLRHSFVDYDDPEYILENPYVRRGLSWEGFVWAFTTGHEGNWFPLTWISHMVDIGLYGEQSGMHHLTSVLLHLLNTLLLFRFFNKTTGARWRSAFVAFLFALHPLHVESVAWVAERKDVLSTLLALTALLGYARYVEKPGPGRYLMAGIPFALGLMAKPMIVTLPFVMLLMDFWPLKRIATSGPAPAGRQKKRGHPKAGARSVAALAVEKLPLLALSAASAVVTFLVQKHAGAVTSLDAVPLAMRLGNAAVSYLAYIAKTLWPSGLAVFYPYPVSLPLWQPVAAVLLLSAVSFGVLRRLRSQPYLAVGWFWFLGTLVPVIGLVQVGMQSRADRYTYLPLIGLFLMVAWGIPEIFERRAWGKRSLAITAGAVCASCLGITWHQVRYWRDSLSLFQHAAEVTVGNFLAYNGVGVALRAQGRIEEAISNYREAVKLRPQWPVAQSNLGEACLKQGRVEEALPPLREALRLRPDYAQARINLAIALRAIGRNGDSEAEYRNILALQADSAEAHSGLGQLLASLGRDEEGLLHLREAVRLRPDDADFHYNLASLLAVSGRREEAAEQFGATLHLNPEDASAHFNLGTLFAEMGRMNEAVAEFSAAVRFRPGYARAHFNLGSALAGLDRLDEAIDQFEEALRIQPDFPEARASLRLAQALRTQLRK